ncbi:3' exoribonuclease family domain 1-domain-containing protein [Penicillium capsulatum]|uniref:3' exoribonuclease family domain 1-domain-containing protein n=1 Tax=Penicillium capsulatum TaxID=69766 RepID=A0A9W9LGE5_9EURO|nr:3' exoribonuclease family domain 1-domain-containing protein [Penicillium capsulatum]
MPLDTSTTYPLTRLRLDGRRWNELRLLSAQISTNPASSGSSYLSMGNTAIMCSVHGPAEGRRGESSGAAGNAGASVEVDVNIAGFAGVDRKRRAAGNDRQSLRVANTLRSAFQSHLHTYLYPHSTISIHVSVLSADGSLLAAAINACTLALVDAGIPMPGLLCGCTAGMSGAASTPRDPRHDELDPLLDLSLPEEQELPSLTVGTTTSVPVGENKMDDEEGDMKVAVLTMDSKLHCTYIDTMLAVGIDGCSQIRELLEGPLNPSFLSSLVVEYNIPSSSIEMDSMTFSSAMATMDMPSAALSSAMPTGTGMSMPDMGDMDMSCKISVSRSSQVGFS